MSEMSCMKCRVLDFKESLCEDEFCKMYYGEGNGIDFINAVKASACPTVPMDDLISRQAALDWLKNEWNGKVMSLFDGIKALPSAQSDLNEWCYDCKEYDQEQHCCHRWSKVIRETIEDFKQAQQEQRWIPVSEKLPAVDEKVLATTVWNDVTTAWRIGVDKWFIHEGGTNATTEDLIAWIPLPEPWKGEET